MKAALLIQAKRWAWLWAAVGAAATFAGGDDDAEDEDCGEQAVKMAARTRILMDGRMNPRAAEHPR